jgi:hypothetical protein
MNRRLSGCQFGRGSVYRFVYWAGVMTTILWVALSAYSALNGF